MSSKHKWIIFTFCAFLIVLVVGLRSLNQWISSQVDSVPQEIAAEEEGFLETAQEESISLEGKELVRKQYLDPSRQYTVNKIYAGDIFVAQFKSQGEEIFDLEGDIPSEKINFRDQSANTHGYEYYEGNQRHGEYVEYYSSGEVKFEKRYAYGKLIQIKQYFIDGTLRMTADYSDALLNSADDEVGEGKTYYRSGVLQYEWCLTNSKSQRYKKSYNTKGRLMQEKIYNDIGELAETVDYPFDNN